MHPSVKFLSLLSLVGACASHPSTKESPSASSNGVMTAAARVEHGRKLVTIGGCHDCHTPMKFDPALGLPVPQMDRMLSGHPEGAPDPESTVSGHDMAVIGPTFTSFKLPF